MQLVAYGAQDIYLTGNPQITFFKVVYRRHTNFSMEAIKQTWNGSASTDGQCSATISRNGDLIHRMYIEVMTTVGTTTTQANPGSQGITTVELEIGGQKIDKHTGQWMEAWTELTEPNPDCTTGATDTTAGTLFQNMSGMGGQDHSTGSIANIRHFVPLQFWFCRNVGLALPLIALQYHEVKVILDHTYATIYSGGPSTAVTNNLWCDYIYLDTDERRRFAQVSHEYLIEQVQEQTWSTSSNELNFNHPVKELIWTNGYTEATGFEDTLTDTWTLKLNGHDRFEGRDFSYFTRTQVWQHHSGVGGLDTNGTDGAKDSIAVYSFALKPEEHQPSGTCNFSRIDNAILESDCNLAASDGGFRVYAVNYNVLRIMSGMGGLAYSN